MEFLWKLYTYFKPIFIYLITILLKIVSVRIVLSLQKPISIYERNIKKC